MDKKYVKQIFELRNYLLIRKVCEISKNDSRFFIIAGETGSGKTEGLVKFSEEDSECIKYIRLRKSMTTTDFFSEIANSFGYHFSYRTYFRFMNWIRDYINESGQKHLLIIDEGGMFHHQQLSLIHELRDLTESNLGIVLAGPKYFVERLKNWNLTHKNGVPEFFRRVNMIVPLNDLTREEIIGVCQAHNITSKKDINSKFLKINNIGDLTNAIENYINYGDGLFY